MRRRRSALMLAACLMMLAGCWADDATRVVAGSFDDIARQVAQKSGGTSDDAARWLRTLGSTEDDAARLGQGILQTAGQPAGERRVGAWIDDAITSLAPEDQARVRSVALGATCDALDSAAQGQAPDLGSLVLNGLGGLSPSVDQQLLRTQLDDMFSELQAGGEAAFAARVEILFACMLLDS